MSEPKGVQPGPKSTDSRQEVKEALRRVLESGHGRAASLKDVSEASDFSHQTVHTRLKELREDPASDVRSGEIGGTTVYWIESPKLVTSGGMNLDMIDGFLRHSTDGRVSLSDSDQLGVGSLAFLVIGLLSAIYVSYTVGLGLIEVALLAFSLFAFLMVGGMGLISKLGYESKQEE